MGKIAPFIVVLLLFVYSTSFADCADQCRAQYADYKAGISSCIASCSAPTQTRTTPKKKKEEEEKKQEDQPAAGSSCQSQYQQLKDSCLSTTETTAQSCDENNSPELQQTGGQAQQQSTAPGSDDAAVQQACGQAGGLSQSAKKAMTSFRDSCSGALEQCRSACSELATFLREPTCLSAIGKSQATAETEASSLERDCTRHQAEVDSAEKSISNYSNTGTGAAACQAAAAGTSAPKEAEEENEKKTFCDANPSYPGCANSQAAANCDDPSQANNKVCVCSKNPGHAMCLGTQSMEQSSVSNSVDSDSRLPSSQADIGGGDNPDLPGINMGERVGGEDGVGIDGRQGGAAVGNSSVGGGSGSSQRSAGSSGEGPPIIPGGSGTYGGGGSGGMGYASGSSAAYAAAGARSGNKVTADGSPDLRQFLPGGRLDPRREQGMAGGVGKDGITGPHSSNWDKIKNRYEMLKGTLAPDAPSF